jgi:hypothetical protein
MKMEVRRSGDIGGHSIAGRAVWTVRAEPFDAVELDLGRVLRW